MERHPLDPKKPKPLKDFKILPDTVSNWFDNFFRVIAKAVQIGTRNPWWYYEAIRRNDPRVTWNDFLMRMPREGRRRQNALNMESSRARARYNILSWHPTTDEMKDNELRQRVLSKLSPAQIARNTTRGTTPGLVNFTMGEAGGRIEHPRLSNGQGTVRGSRPETGEKRKRAKRSRTQAESVGEDEESIEEVVDLNNQNVDPLLSHGSLNTTGIGHDTNPRTKRRRVDDLASPIDHGDNDRDVGQRRRQRRPVGDHANRASHVPLAAFNAQVQPTLGPSWRARHGPMMADTDEDRAVLEDAELRIGSRRRPETDTPFNAAELQPNQAHLAEALFGPQVNGDEPLIEDREALIRRYIEPGQNTLEQVDHNSYKRVSSGSTTGNWHNSRAATLGDYGIVRTPSGSFPQEVLDYQSYGQQPVSKSRAPFDEHMENAEPSLRRTNISNDVPQQGHLPAAASSERPQSGPIIGHGRRNAKAVHGTLGLKRTPRGTYTKASPRSQPYASRPVSGPRTVADERPLEDAGVPRRCQQVPDGIPEQDSQPASHDPLSEVQTSSQGIVDSTNSQSATIRPDSESNPRQPDPGLLSMSIGWSQEELDTAIMECFADIPEQPQEQLQTLAQPSLLLHDPSEGLADSSSTQSGYIRPHPAVSHSLPVTDDTSLPSSIHLQQPTTIPGSRPNAPQPAPGPQNVYSESSYDQIEAEMLKSFAANSESQQESLPNLHKPLRQARPDQGKASSSNSQSENTHAPQVMRRSLPATLNDRLAPNARQNHPAAPRRQPRKNAPNREVLAPLRASGYNGQHPDLQYGQDHAASQPVHDALDVNATQDEARARDRSPSILPPSLDCRPGDENPDWGLESSDTQYLMDSDPYGMDLMSANFPQIGHAPRQGETYPSSVPGAVINYNDTQIPI